MDYIKINQQAWDHRTTVHVDSQFYDIKSFLAGKSSLNPIELEQVGEVKGKSLLHLQCHFGQDTLSWARLGANVTGVDLSPQAISTANNLAQQLQLPATFIASDIYAFGETNQQQFDIVFTSYGVLCWLPDLDKWAQTIAKSLRVGGEFHLVEFHPFHDVFAGYGYFPSQAPDIEQEGTYTENCQGETNTVVSWQHSLSEVINALIKAGIKIESFNEFAYSPYPCFDGLEAVENKGFVYKVKNKAIPLVYAIKGKK